jgi:glycosyltransferase involved in cell wall biosynthesis
MNVGGPARQVLELARGLREYGYETTLATGSPESWEGDLRARAEELGIRVISIPGLASRVHPLRDARALAGLTSLMGRERPRIVHTHTAKAGALGRAAARLAGVDARVHTFHGTVFESYFSKGASRWIVRAERQLAKWASRIVAVSHATADELEGIGIPKEKIRVIEPVIDLAPFLGIERRSGGLRAELGVADDETLIGWVGRFVPIKDPLAFAAAAADAAGSHPRARFVMIGGGPLEAELRAQVERLGVGPRVAILGFRADMAQVYGALDLLVSTSRREGMPVVVLEAMAAALPSIVTSVGGAPELIVPERSGYLVPPADRSALVAAIGNALSLPREMRERLGAVGRVRARERYGLERGLRRHAQLYEELLEGK